MTDIKTDRYTLLLGDCLERLKELPDNSVDALVTDPPYGWRLMGSPWDGMDIEEKAKRGNTTFQNSLPENNSPPRGIAKPSSSAGEYDLSPKGNWAFQQWTRDWVKEAARVLKPGSHAVVFCGPRTYHRMACGVEDAGLEIRDQLQWIFGSGFPKSRKISDGIGTGLKPANEPIVLARKPISEKSVQENFIKWGTGGINIELCRIGSGGRWPANAMFDEDAAAALDEQQSGASRFFYCAKAHNTQRNCGLVGMEKKIARNTLTTHNGKGDYRGVDKKPLARRANFHPTVKPFGIMRYLCQLIAPPGSTILDPFLGSGTTGAVAVACGFKFIGIEKELEYLEISKRRIADVRFQPEPTKE